MLIIPVMNQQWPINMLNRALSPPSLFAPQSYQLLYHCSNSYIHTTGSFVFLQTIAVEYFPTGCLKGQSQDRMVSYSIMLLITHHNIWIVGRSHSSLVEGTWEALCSSSWTSIGQPSGNLLGGEVTEAYISFVFRKPSQWLECQPVQETRVGNP